MRSLGEKIRFLRKQNNVSQEVLADYLGISVDDERHAALMVKAIIDDPDNKGGGVFVHWYWDRIHNGEGVDFEDFLDD